MASWLHLPLLLHPPPYPCLAAASTTDNPLTHTPNLCRPQQLGPMPNIPSRAASDRWAQGPSGSSSDRWTHDQFNTPHHRPDWSHPQPQPQAPFRPAVPSLPPAPASQPHPSHQPPPQPLSSPMQSPAALNPSAGLSQAGSGPLPETAAASLGDRAPPGQIRPAEQLHSRLASPLPGASMSWADQAERDLRAGLADEASFPPLGQNPPGRQNGRQNGGQKPLDDLSFPALGQPAGQNGQNGQNGHSAARPEAPAGAWSKAQHLRAIGESPGSVSMTSSLSAP